MITASVVKELKMIYNLGLNIMTLINFGFFKLSANKLQCIKQMMFNKVFSALPQNQTEFSKLTQKQPPQVVL